VGQQPHSWQKRPVLVSFLVPLALTLSLATCAFAAGCGSVAPASTATTAPASTATTAPAGDLVQLAMSKIGRAATAAPTADIESATASLQSFGVDLYRVLAEGAGQGNLVLSPSSIATALAMTYAGAAGATAEEMAATLHFTLQGAALHQAFNSLDATLLSRNFKDKDQDGRDVGVVLRTANSLWGQRDTRFEQAFLDGLAANYGAGIRLVDFKTAAEQARQAINSWVAEQTDDKIPELIAQGALDDLTRLVLVNAIYLDATWMSQFDPAATSDGPFATLAGQTVTAPMMRQMFSYPYGTGDGWQAVELPYLGGKLSLLVIVPDVGRFDEIEGRLAGSATQPSLIDEAVAALNQGPEVSLTLPKFKFRTQAGLRDALVALGMKTAFDSSAADFSGMTKQERLNIDDVIHEAYIAVDEEGTEAAAATAVIMRASGMPMQPVELTIDRPFLFALRDVETGAVLFLGRVTDPTA
jgi:serpin B